MLFSEFSQQNYNKTEIDTYALKNEIENEINAIE